MSLKEKKKFVDEFFFVFFLLREAHLYSQNYSWLPILNFTSSLATNQSVSEGQTRVKLGCYLQMAERGGVVTYNMKKIF